MDIPGYQLCPNGINDGPPFPTIQLFEDASVNECLHALEQIPVVPVFSILQAARRQITDGPVEDPSAIRVEGGTCEDGGQQLTSHVGGRPGQPLQQQGVPNICG